MRTRIAHNVALAQRLALLQAQLVHFGRRASPHGPSPRTKGGMIVIPAGQLRPQSSTSCGSNCRMRPQRGHDVGVAPLVEYSSSRRALREMKIMTLYIQRPLCEANSCPKWTPWRAPQEEEEENVRKTEEYPEAGKSRG